MVARSFGRIFYRNALNNGLLAIVCPEAVDALEEGTEVEVDLEGSIIRCGSSRFGFSPFSPAVRSMIAAGGLIEQTKRRLAAG